MRLYAINCLCEMHLSHKTVNIISMFYLNSNKNTHVPSKGLKKWNIPSDVDEASLNFLFPYRPPTQFTAIRNIFMIISLLS